MIPNAAKHPRRGIVVAGVMSGTSADGIDVALCRIAPGPGNRPTVKLLGHAGFPYTSPVRRAVLAAMSSDPVSPEQLSRLHWRLGALYADAIEATSTRFTQKPALVGCHGQTIYHAPTPARYLGAPVRATCQIGEASIIAERLRVPVVSDFRPADLAAGGQGAPLVPMLDATLFAHRTRSRILLNLGGIANLTAIPAGTDTSTILAFDTGPANMVIDGCMEQLFGKRFDRDGRTSRRGRILEDVLALFLREPYLALPPPKSTGREQFGTPFVTRFIAACKLANGSAADTVATATAFTAESTLDAYRRFVWPHLSRHAPLARGTDLCISGGGTQNSSLMSLLRDAFQPLGVRVLDLAELGLPAQAKEAVAFALLAWLTWHRLPGNVPSATGASRPVLLGKVTYA